MAPQILPAVWGALRSSPVVVLGCGYPWKDLAGLGFADTSAAPPADARSQLSLSYPLSLGAGGVRFMSLVICLSLIFQLLLCIWTDCSQVTYSQLSWGVCTNLSFSHNVFLAYPHHLIRALSALGWHNLFWSYRLLSETQSLSSSGLDLLLLFAAFHV